MAIKDKNGIQLSPCICARVRFELGLTTKEPTNKTKCTKEYWERVVIEIGSKRNINGDVLTKVKLKFPF
jgi:hypothetical protein